jgi:hypothetical protein
MLGGIVAMTGKSARGRLVSVCVQEQFVVFHVKLFFAKTFSEARYAADILLEMPKKNSHRSFQPVVNVLR